MFFDFRGGKTKEKSGCVSKPKGVSDYVVPFLVGVVRWVGVVEMGRGVNWWVGGEGISRD